MEVRSEQAAKQEVEKLLAFWTPLLSENAKLGSGPDGLTKATFDLCLDVDTLGEAVLEMVRLGELIGVGWTVYQPFGHYELELVRDHGQGRNGFRLPSLRWCRMLLESQED